MRHVLTVIALISLLLCLGSLALLIGTLGSDWTIMNKQTDTHTNTLTSGQMELRYDSIQRTSDRSIMKSKKHDFAGVSYMSTESGGVPGASWIVPEYYPVILFAIIPLLWFWDLAKGRGRKNANTPAPAETSGTAAPH